MPSPLSFNIPAGWHPMLGSPQVDEKMGICGLVKKTNHKDSVGPRQDVTSGSLTSASAWGSLEPQAILKLKSHLVPAEGQ